MKTSEVKSIQITADVKAPIGNVWNCWTQPHHIIKWNQASDDWHTTRAENDLKPGGKFVSRMEAKDGSFGFDFSGTYDEVIKYQKIAYTMEDGRKVNISFTENEDHIHISETFDAEQTHSLELQRDGWQAILDNFKKFTEEMGKMETLHFEIRIQAPKEHVYNTMLDKEQYQVWTYEFNPGSYFEGSWQKGSKILFLGKDEDGNSSGMVSRIKENLPNAFVSIEHLGIVENGNEITSGPEVSGWAGAFENYTFTELEGETILKIDLDVNQEFKDYFLEAWPKALDKLKFISENTSL